LRQQLEHTGSIKSVDDEFGIREVGLEPARWVADLMSAATSPPIDIIPTGRHCGPVGNLGEPKEGELEIG
jgi:hypothetical protein